VLSTLRLAAGPVAEIVDLDTALAHCRVDSDDQGGLMEVYIAAARQWSEGWLGRALAQQQLLWTVSDTTAAPAPMLRFAPTPAPGTLLVPSVATPWPPRRPMEFPRSPVTEVTAVTVGGFAIDDAPLSEDDYQLDLATEPARILLRSTAATSKADRLTVAFTAGYADPAQIPRPIHLAQLVIIAHLWEHRGDAGGDLPKAAQSLMWPFRLAAFG